MRIRRYKKKSDQLSYFIYRDNDQVLLNSQGYANKEGRDNGIAFVIENASNPDQYDGIEGEDGLKYFILKAKNGQEIARSEGYENESNFEAAINSCISSIGTINLEGEQETPL